MDCGISLVDKQKGQWERIYQNCNYLNKTATLGYFDSYATTNAEFILHRLIHLKLKGNGTVQQDLLHEGYFQ